MTAIGRTMIRQISASMIGAGGTTPLPVGAEALAWQAAVITNGGTLSAARLKTVNKFITNEKAAGTWALTDDYWPLWAENAPQALTSLKQLRLATAVAAPTFTANRGYLFNGTTNYLNTGMVPSTHSVVTTPSSMRLAAYELVNSSASITAGSKALSALNGIHLRNRSGTAITTSLNGSTISSVTPPLPSSIGLHAASRSSAANIYDFYQRGVPVVQVAAPASVGNVSLSTMPIYIGCYNDNGTATSFRACTVGLVCTGAALSPAQEVAQNNNVEAWAMMVGAAV